MTDLFQIVKKVHNLNPDILMPKGVSVYGITLQNSTLSLLDLKKKVFINKVKVYEIKHYSIFLV